MSVELWTYILVGMTFAVYLYIGYYNRVRDTRGFYVAGQGVPAIANGAATGADWMSAASFISMAGLISFMGLSLIHISEPTRRRDSSRMPSSA